jgi:hypothetical protein
VLLEFSKKNLALTRSASQNQNIRDLLLIAKDKEISPTLYHHHLLPVLASLFIIINIPESLYF